MCAFIYSCNNFGSYVDRKSYFCPNDDNFYKECDRSFIVCKVYNVFFLFALIFMTGANNSSRHFNRERHIGMKVCR